MGGCYKSLGDTWVWDGTNWTQKFPAASPSRRSGVGYMAGDAVHAQVVLFGGSEAFVQEFNDTWVWGIPTILVPVDIKPTSCPNPLNTKSEGVLPVAILGTSTFDATKIDPSTIRLAGVAPLRSALADVSAPFSPFVGKTSCQTDCNTLGPDGILDLTLNFDIQSVVAALGQVTDGQCLVVTLTGNLLPQFRSTPIKGEDVVIIQAK